MIAWPDLSCEYRAARDFLAFLTYLLSPVVGFHLSFTACFTYDSDAALIALGGCLAARCAATPAALKPLLPTLLESHVRASVPPPSSTRLACLFVLVMVCTSQRLWFWIAVSADLDQGVHQTDRQDSRDCLVCLPKERWLVCLSEAWR